MTRNHAFRVILSIGGTDVKAIQPDHIQHYLDNHVATPLFVHVETTNGAYATHNDPDFHNAGMFIRNANIKYSIGQIKGNGPYRVGLKLDHGWLYVEGLTDYELHGEQLLLAGHDRLGRLACALHIDIKPLPQGASEVEKQ
nr:MULTISPECIES: YojF family protein [unclassified Exiguobacterium]